MNLLVDTHAVIWAINGSDRLPPKTKQFLEDIDNPCFVSIVSLWEIGIKHSLGRLDLKIDLDQGFQAIEEAFELLPITPSHILKSTTLPFHHQDPFDRLLIAQAIS